MRTFFAGDLVLQCDDRLVMTQLQNVVEALIGFALDNSQLIEHLWGWNKRLFADYVATQAQTCSDMRVVQVIGRADRYVVQRGSRVALEVARMIKKELELGKNSLWGEMLSIIPTESLMS